MLNQKAGLCVRQWMSAGEPDREKVAVESSHDWGPAASICILFLQREFNPKKERDFSIVRQALFGVKSRRSAEAAFLKGLVSALRLFS